MWRHVMATHTVLSPHYDPKKLSSVLNELNHDLTYIAAGYRFKEDEQVDADQRLMNSSKSLLKLYKQMQKSGIIDAFRKVADEIRSKHAKKDGH